MRRSARWALAAFFVAGCAGAAPVRPEPDSLRDEVRALRRENEALTARVESLSRQVDLLTARVSRGAVPQQPAEAPRAGASPSVDSPAAARAPEPIVPPDLAVVRVSPEPARPSGGGRSVRPTRPAPPVPTAVPIREPDLSTVDALSRPGRRPLSAEAETELRSARAQAGLARAHALEDFAARYPQHPAADNALVEASTAYHAGGREDAACTLARRAVDEYPAGDAQSDALEQLAACEGRRGASESEQRLLARLRTDFPGTPAAQRAEARLSQESGPGGGSTPREVPARSSP